MAKKIFIPALFLFLLASSSFAAGFRIISTEYFDVMYEDGCEKTARTIAESADTLYEEICAETESRPWYRYPVVVIGGCQKPNAYFSAATCNHILFYDTPPAGDIDFSRDSVRSIFRHELAHAVSSNMKNGFWKSMGTLGDVYNWGYFISVPALIQEGNSISRESQGDEGRLNDPFFLFRHRQALAEKKFPKCHNATGARDTWPSGNIPYWFGGPFTDYIKKTYGKEKYAEFWHRLINRNLTYRGAFRKTYGKSMSKVWKDFENQVKLPENLMDPAEKAEPYYGRKLSRPNHLAPFEGGFYFYDESDSTIYRSEISGRITKVCVKKNTAHLSSDRTGRLLTVQFYSENHSETKSRVAVLDTQKKRLHTLGGTGLCHGSSVLADGKILTAAVKADHQEEKIIVAETDENGREKILYEKKIRGNARDIFLGEDGSISFVGKDGMTWNFCRTNFFPENDGGTIERFSFGKDIRVRNMSSCGNGEFCFTYADASVQSFPRFGKIESDGTMRLSQKDFSGGVFSPVAAGGRIFFVTDNFNHGKIYSAEEDIFFDGDESTANPDAAADDEIPGDEFFSERNLASKRIIFPVFRKGFLVPFTDIKAYKISTEILETDNDGLLADKQIYAGITAVTGTITDTTQVMAGLAVNPVIGKYGAGLRISGGSRTQLFSWQNNSSAIFDGHGFSQFTNFFTASLTLSLTDPLYFQLTEENSVFQGRESFCRNENFKDRTNYHYVQNAFTAKIGALQKTGGGFHEVFACSLSATYKIASMGAYDKNSSGNVFNRISTAECMDYDFRRFQSLGFSAGLQTPRTLPFDAGQTFTLNMPASASARLLPHRNVFFDVTASLLLFGMELQNDMGLLPLYFNRLEIRGIYGAKWKQLNRDFEIAFISSDIENAGRMYFENYAGLTLTLTQTINTGLLASGNGQIKVSLEADRYIQGNDRNRTKTRLDVTFSLLK